MESKTGNITAISNKTKGIAIDGTWYSTSSAVQQHFSKLNKGPCEYKTNGDEIIFVKSSGAQSSSGAPTSVRQDDKATTMLTAYAKDLVVAEKAESMSQGIDIVLGAYFKVRQALHDPASYFSNQVKEQVEQSADEEPTYM